jgi:hypothetical protein
MKSKVLITLSLLTIMAAGLVFGQTTLTVPLNIPFKFMVGKKEMPAGKYDFVLSSGERSNLVLRNQETRKAMFVPIIERLAETHSSEKHGAKVVFDRVGEQRFLSEFWPPDNADGCLVGITKGEERHEIVSQE